MPDVAKGKNGYIEDGLDHSLCFQNKSLKTQQKENLQLIFMP